MLESINGMFPRFDRNCFNDPERLFYGLTVKDFISVVHEVRKSKDMGFPAPGYDSVLFSGWVDTNGELASPSVNNGWDLRVSSHPVWSPSITFTPSAVNQIIFPYIVTVTESFVTFDDAKFLRNRGSISFFEQYPVGVVEKAMLNVELPLGHALLLEGFTSVPLAAAVGKHQPSNIGLLGLHNSVDSHPLLPLEVVVGSGLLDFVVPFDVFKESLLFLSGVDSSASGFLHNNLIDLAELVNYSHVG